MSKFSKNLIFKDIYRVRIPPSAPKGNPLKMLIFSVFSRGFGFFGLVLFFGIFCCFSVLSDVKMMSKF